MPGLYDVEVEPEVGTWLDSLSDRDFGRVDFLVGVLAEQAETLGEPHSRHLGGKVRELRFHLFVADPGDVLAGPEPPGGAAHRIPQDPQRQGPAEVRPSDPARSRPAKPRTWPRPRCITAEENVMSKRQHFANDSGHDSYEQVAAARRSKADYREGYEEARRAFLIGQVVRERRLALGLSQTEVATTPA